MTKAFNKKVYPRSFQAGYLVLPIRRPINLSRCMGKKLFPTGMVLILFRKFTPIVLKIVDKDGLFIGPIDIRFLKRYYA